LLFCSHEKLEFKGYVDQPFLGNVPSAEGKVQ